MDYDVIIIGAGMSGLAAGIRLAYFGKRVCILEKHYAYGGLNSYYTLEGREFDVGLHAVTNFAPPGDRHAPFNRLLRQLRLSRDDFDLHEQHHSEVRFPGRTLRFANQIDILQGEVAHEFPDETDTFRKLVQHIREYDDARTNVEYLSTRAVLGEALRDPVLIDMLLCPVMFYGSAEERDMDFTQFVTLFKSIFLEGFARPRGGVRTILKTLVRKFREEGGRLRMRCGVNSIIHEGKRATGVLLESGDILCAPVILSSAGLHETMALLGEGKRISEESENAAGQVSFVESIAVLDCPAAKLGHDATIVFYNDREEFDYSRPDIPVDLRSGIMCCPNNYAAHEGLEEGIVRLTWLADYQPWMTWDQEQYGRAKAQYQEEFLKTGERFLPGFRRHVIFSDMFTPRTIHYYTGHVHGAVYGSPRKRRDGRTHLENLFLCGSDQGYLGIIGAMLSGIMMANRHVLERE